MANQLTIQPGFSIRKTSQYRPNYWGRLEQCQIPCQVFPDNTLSLGPNALKMLFFLYLTGKGTYNRLQQYWTPQADQSIRILTSQKDISRKIGCCRNTLTAAAKELVDRKWIEAPAQRRVRRGELGTNEYFLLNPSTGRRLETLPLPPYFIVPACIIRNEDVHWSLHSMNGCEIALYATLLFRVNQVRRLSFPNDHSLLMKMSQLKRGTRGTYKKALASLERRRLITVDEQSITLCNPITGAPVVVAVDAVNDPANYYNLADGKRIVFNTDNPEALLNWVRNSIPDGEPLIEGNGDEYKIRCPFHDDQNPSLNFNPRKNTFHCFGCREKGTINKLVQRLLGVSEGEAIQQQARALGINCEFKSAESEAEAIYLYADRTGKSLYRVLRYAGKRFSQQRWTNEGWAYGLTGVKKTLYKLPELSAADIVVITEGEKDADRVNKIGFIGRKKVSGNPFEDLPYREFRVVATTAGGADSWQDAFAQLLVPAPEQSYIENRCIVVMPDSDEPGEKYREEIRESLTKRAIPHCVVSFDGFKDVSDYLDGGHSDAQLAQLITEELTKIDNEIEIVARSRSEITPELDPYACI